MIMEHEKKANQDVKGRPPSDEEIFYLQLGSELLKSSLQITNDILKQLIGINSVLLGGSIAVLDRVLDNPLAKKVTLLSFLISLIFAIIGIMPYEKKILINSPDMVKSFQKGALRHKRIFIWLSASVMIIGFVSAILDLLY